MKYLVKLDQKFVLIPDNRTEVEDGTHGLLLEQGQAEIYRSRYPYIVAWVTDCKPEELNAARYALIEVSEAKLKTQLANPRDGEVYTILKLYKKKPPADTIADDVASITLRNMLAEAPQLTIPEKKFNRFVGARLKSEKQFDYLTELGGGNASAGLRTLIEWAIKSKPEVTKKVTK